MRSKIDRHPPPGSRADGPVGSALAGLLRVLHGAVAAALAGPGMLRAQAPTAPLADAPPTVYTAEATALLNRGDPVAAAAAFARGYRDTGVFRYLVFAGQTLARSSDSAVVAHGERLIAYALWHGQTSVARTAALRALVAGRAARGPGTPPVWYAARAAEARLLDLDEVVAWVYQTGYAATEDPALRFRAVEAFAMQHGLTGAAAARYDSAVAALPADPDGALRTYARARRLQIARMHAGYDTLSWHYLEPPIADTLAYAAALDSLARALDDPALSYTAAWTLILPLRGTTNTPRQVAARQWFASFLAARPASIRRADIAYWRATDTLPYTGPTVAASGTRPGWLAIGGVRVAHWCGDAPTTVAYVVPLPSDRYYDEHQIELAASGGRAGVAVWPDQSGRAVYVTAHAGDAPGCRRGGAGSDPRLPERPVSWIGATVYLRTREHPLASPPPRPPELVDAPDVVEARLDGRQFRFRTGTTAATARVTVTNRARRTSASERVGPYSAPDECAAVAAVLARQLALTAGADGTEVHFARGERVRVSTDGGCPVAPGG